MQVAGPVEAPPCNRQRPFFIAGERQGPPERVRAPQRGAVFGSPGVLPLRSQPSAFAPAAADEAASMSPLFGAIREARAPRKDLSIVVFLFSYCSSSPFANSPLHFGDRLWQSSHYPSRETMTTRKPLPPSLYADTARPAPPTPPLQGDRH